MAKTLYCWRCRADIPMLDDDDYAEFQSLFAKEIPEPLHKQLALDFYFELTGLRETNINAIWHHVAAMYGPPCTACGKPLRTPKAKFCASCGHSSMAQD